MRQSTIDRLKAFAKIGCPECYGEGIVSISWNNNPDRCEDVACDCTRDARLAEDGPDDDGDIWSGGFADNH